MGKQEKKRQRIYDFLNAEIKQRIFLLKKSFLRKTGTGGLTKKNESEYFSIALPTTIKKDPRTSLRKYGNELKVLETNVMTAINKS